MVTNVYLIDQGIKMKLKTQKSENVLTKFDLIHSLM